MRKLEDAVLLPKVVSVRKGAVRKAGTHQTWETTFD